METVIDDILFDIYIYELELRAPNLKVEDAVNIKEKIIRAEELFKIIK
jgi:hypothetical protein